MRMLAKYAVPYHLILLDALSRVKDKSYNHSCNFLRPNGLMWD